MDIFGITQKNIHDLIELLFGWDCPPLICLWIARIIIFGIALFVLYKGYRKFICKPKKEKEKYIRQHIDSGYSEYLTKKSQRYYIPTHFQNIAPNHYPDILDSIRSASTENMIEKYVDQIFVADNEDSPLYCVLGGSGMGKTSFLINVLKAYIRKYKLEDKPFEIEMINLAGESYKTKINSITNPHNTILLLDALDENPAAVSCYDDFIKELEDAIEPFRVVVITCRTQFFPDEEHELQQSKILSNSRRKGFYAYTRHYISPFSDQEVEKYLRKRYKLNFRKRKAAKQIVSQCTSFTHRPLLLSYIDTLLTDKKKYNTTLDLYEALINKWLERDTSRIEQPNETQEKLMSFLQVSAVKMYVNFPNSGYFISEDEINSLISGLNLDPLNKFFKGRSLLNRDALGSWKFSHKSFLEFFLAKEYFEKDGFKLDFNGLDVAWTLFRDYCKRELDKNISSNKVELVKSHDLSPTYDVLKVKSGSKFKLRYIEPFNEIRVLEIDARMYTKVEPFISRTKIYYVKVYGYRATTGFNSVFKDSQIEYVSINGDDCSKNFIKEAKTHGVSILNNGVLLNYYDDIDKSDAPLDFKSAYYMHVQPFDFGIFIENSK